MSRQNMDPFGEIEMGEKEPTRQKRKRTCYICNTQKCAAKNRNTKTGYKCTEKTKAKSTANVAECGSIQTVPKTNQTQREEQKSAKKEITKNKKNQAIKDLKEFNKKRENTKK